jgi:DNA replication protein DnaC
MRTTDPGDAARIELLLAELRLPAIKLVWASLAAQADKEGWPAGRFLAALAEHEIAERSRRRLERHLAEARLPPGRTLDSFDFEAVPVISKAQVMALAAGDAWLNNGANLLLFGPPGGGKSHLAAALGFALVEGAGAYCSPAPSISSSGCKLRVASALSKPPSPSSTNSTC